MVRTASRLHGYGTVPHAWERGEADMLLAIEDESVILVNCQKLKDRMLAIAYTYHFVGHGDEVELLNQLGDLEELLAREHLANRVVRRVQHDHFRPGRDRSSAKRRDETPPIGAEVVQAYLSSSKSIFQSSLVGLGFVGSGWSGT